MARRLTVLTVAYAFARLGRDGVGGAEQIASALERGISAAGMRSIVVAAAASDVSSSLVPIDVPDGPLTPEVIEHVHGLQRAAIADVLRNERVGIVHMHGVDFHSVLPDAAVPVLATLHLPLAWYPAEALRPARPNTFLNGVSRSQHETRPTDAALLPPVENGVPVDRMMYRRWPGSYALCLGRICEEKGFHLGVQAARRARFAAIIAGHVFPYPAHQSYFARELAPLLDEHRRFVGAANFAAKRRLLAHARCLLVCSIVPETSSLVAMESLASGTPVIAFRSGALPDIVEHGRTGFLVDSVEEMAEAIAEAGRLDRAECRRAAESRFHERRMIDAYLSLYARILAGVAAPVGTRN